MRFRQLISDLAGDCIIILSSHIVSDIDTIADKVAIMREGRLITVGEPAEIINRASGNIFEVLLASEELIEFKNRYRVIESSRQNDKIRVRYISEGVNSHENSTLVSASLEDSYLFLTQNKQ